MRTKELALRHIKAIADQKTKSDKASKQTEYGLKDKHNPLFDLSVDFYRYCSIIKYIIVYITNGIF